MARDKTAGKSAEPEKIPQPHGGALLSGGVPGNSGGSGRPPSEIRKRLRGSFEERIRILEEIAEDPDMPPKERIRAIDILAKYGLGTKAEVTGPDDGAIPHSITVTRRVVKHGDT